MCLQDCSGSVTRWHDGWRNILKPMRMVPFKSVSGIGFFQSVTPPRLKRSCRFYSTAKLGQDEHECSDDHGGIAGVSERSKDVFRSGPCASSPHDPRGPAAWPDVKTVAAIDPAIWCIHWTIGRLGIGIHAHHYGPRGSGFCHVEPVVGAATLGKRNR